METFSTFINHWQANAHIQFLTGLAVSIIIALMFRFLLTNMVMRMAERTKSDLDDRLVETFSNPIVVAVFSVGVLVTVQHAYPKLMELNLPIRGVLLSATIIVWLIAFLQFSNFIIVRMAQTEGRFRFVQPRTQPVFQIMSKGVIILGAAYFLIVAWDLNITGWLASAGVAGIAIGFAAKDTLANLISGIFIMADAPYKIGDYIVLDDGDRGRVTDIGIRSTRMITRDDVEVIIPNAVIGNSRITNQSGGPRESFRLRIPVGVAYGSDIDKVREILMDAAEAEPLVQPEPEHRVRMRGFGNSSLDFELLVWVENPELRGLALDRILDNIYKRFGQNGIEIPYPKRDVYLHQVNPPE